MIREYESFLDLNFASSGALRTFEDRKGRFNLFLAMLILPVLLLLFFYILMISRMIVHRERNEISVLQSRGAGHGQIVLRYLIESGVLVILALIAGPPLGLLFCHILGASSGFMEFVNRHGAEFSLNASAYLFSLGAGVLLILTIILPVYRAGRLQLPEDYLHELGDLRSVRLERRGKDILIKPADD